MASEENERNESMSKTKSLWWMIPVALLVASVGGQVVLAYAATSDPSFAVEEDYYQKAVDWDAKRAQDAVNEKLGWQVKVEPMNASLRGPVLLSATLIDRAGKPISGATLDVEAFHNARMNQKTKVTLVEKAPGRYQAELSVRRPGLWELRFRAVKSPDTFTSVVQRDVGAESAR